MGDRGPGPFTFPVPASPFPGSSTAYAGAAEKMDQRDQLARVREVGAGCPSPIPLVSHRVAWNTLYRDPQAGDLLKYRFLDTVPDLAFAFWTSSAGG